jgi:prepilin-type N-terminal cleavage/methylation domain-containing protein
MKSRKGFTLIELMVVVLIVGILAAVAIPILRGRIDAAKWSEGKAMMGTIATAIRAYHAEHGVTGTAPTTLDVGVTGLGIDIAGGDLDGTYFTSGCFDIGTPGMDPLTFTITCTAGDGTRTEAPTTPASYTLTELGVFTAL